MATKTTDGTALFFLGPFDGRAARVPWPPPQELRWSIFGAAKVTVKPSVQATYPNYERQLLQSSRFFAANAYHNTQLIYKLELHKDGQNPVARYRLLIPKLTP